MSFEVKNGGFGKRGNKFGKTGGFSMNGTQDDPLENVEYTGYLDEDLAEELTELQKGFNERAKKERKRMQAATDSEFWFAVYFKTRENKEKFLTEVGLPKKIFGDKYIDGHKWAKAKGIDL